MSSLCATCLFCRIIRKEIPSAIVYESQKTLAFMDLFPLSMGHILVIPKYHAAKVHEVPDAYLDEILPVAKKIAQASISVTGVTEYNILQNNGREAHQEIEHVHFHIIPKPNKDEGLGIHWPAKKGDAESLQELARAISKQY